MTKYIRRGTTLQAYVILNVHAAKTSRSGTTPLRVLERVEVKRIAIKGYSIARGPEPDHSGTR